MKDVEEYSHSDLATCLDEAEKIAMSAIDEIYHNNKDEDKVCYEDVHKVKKATQILELVSCLRIKQSTKV